MCSLQSRESPEGRRGRRFGFFPLSYSLNPNRAVEADYLKCTFKKNLLVIFTVFGFAAVVHLDQVSHDKQVFFT